jgi:hypothetical protein
MRARVQVRVARVSTRSRHPLGALTMLGPGLTGPDFGELVKRVFGGDERAPAEADNAAREGSP